MNECTNGPRSLFSICVWHFFCTNLKVQNGIRKIKHEGFSENTTIMISAFSSKSVIETGNDFNWWP